MTETFCTADLAGTRDAYVPGPCTYPVGAETGAGGRERGERRVDGLHHAGWERRKARV